MASDGDTALQTIALQKSDSPGVYEGSFTTGDTGRYVLRLVATYAAGSDLGDDELYLTVGQSNMETERIARDDLRLRAIANRSAGLFAALTALPDIVDQLIETLAGAGDTSSDPVATITPLHSFPLGFAAMVTLLTSEWLLRRRWQLR